MGEVCADGFCTMQLFLGNVGRRVGRGSKLVGCGPAVPTSVISNDDLSKF